MLDLLIISQLNLKVIKMQKQLIDAWMQAAVELGINIVAPFSLTASGETIDADVWVKDFGAERGMLIFSEYSKIKNFTNDIVDQGYGYTILDPPRPDEVFDKNEYIEMLSDWGWSSDDKDRPLWLCGFNSEVP